VVCATGELSTLPARRSRCPPHCLVPFGKGTVRCANIRRHVIDSLTIQAHYRCSRVNPRCARVQPLQERARYTRGSDVRWKRGAQGVRQHGKHKRKVRSLRLEVNPVSCAAAASNNAPAPSCHWASCREHAVCCFFSDVRPGSQCPMLYELD